MFSMSKINGVPAAKNKKASFGFNGIPREVLYFLLQENYFRAEEWACPTAARPEAQPKPPGP
jgi:hypothetical protein